MALLRRFMRVLTLTVCAVLGTSALVYLAPGYFSDTREMDASHSGIARDDLQSLRREQHSLGALLHGEITGWLRGDLGHSRHFDVPVGDLLKERARSSTHLLFAGLLIGWSAALLLAVPLSVVRHPGLDLAIAIASAILLAIPVGALATVCLVTEVGGPAMVLGALVAIRDFKLLHRSLCALQGAPHLLFARAQGMSVSRLLYAHMAPALRQDLVSMGVVSFTLALSALVPVEVVFDRPGLGQLAWTAAMNRDLPVLSAITALMAL